MKRKNSLAIRIAIIVALVAVGVPLARWVYAQGRENHVHMTSDWSNRHMVYSRPRSWASTLRMQRESRFNHQQLRRNPPQHGHGGKGGHQKPNQEPLHPDWGTPLGVGGTTGAEMFPAKFNFDLTAAPDCTNDFIVYATSLPGAVGVDASQTGTFNNNSVLAGETVTITNGAFSITLTASAGSNTGTNFQIGAGSNFTVTATNLAAAIQRNGFVVPVFSFAEAAPNDNVVFVGAGNAGPGGNSITLASTLSGFTWNGATLTGGAGQATVIGYNNLYSTQGSVGGLCNQNGPSVMWSYAVGTNPVVTSPVLSLDGTKIAFVENPTGSAAILHLLRWKSGDGATVNNASPPSHTLNLAGGDNWTNCLPGVSCIANITFSGTTSGDSNSSPYYDFDDDTLYVGDDSGKLHKFTGVFNGTPAEVTSAPWPMTINAGAVLSSPVYDGVSHNLFVGDSTGLLSFVKESTSTAGACASGSAPCLGTPNIQVGAAGSIIDAPIVDGTAQTVFAFNGTDTTRNGTVLQTNTAFTGTPVALDVGGTGSGSYIHAGTFDDAYFNSAAGAITGHMYVCGKDPAHVDQPALYRLNFAADGTLSNSVGTPLTGLVSGDNEACSAVTEVENPNATPSAKEWIFFSVGNLANNAPGGAGNPIPAGPCRTNNAGCVISIDITNAVAWPPATVTGAMAVPAGPATGPNGGNIDSTGGIIVDNVAADATGLLQVSNMYFAFTNNSTGTGPGTPSCNVIPGVGCAIKLTQATLQ